MMESDLSAGIRIDYTGEKKGKPMKTKKWALWFGIAALLAGLCAHHARADIYWESETVSTNIPNQRDGTSVQKYYFTANACRVDLGDRRVLIVDYNTMKLYCLDTKAKTCTELNLTKLPGLSDAGADSQKVDKMLGAIMAMQVSPTNESKTIAGYRCHKCNVRVAMLDGEYWVSKDVKGYQEWRALGAKAGAIADQNPMLRQIGVAGMAEKLGGFPVYTVTHVMGGTHASTLKRVEQKSLDPALFVVPKEYTVKKIGN